MTAVDLLMTLRLKGIELVPAGDRLRFRPGEAVTAEERAALRRHKGAVLALLASAPRPAPAELAAGLSAGSLADWAARGEIVTLFSRTLDASIHLAPDPVAVRQLVEAGVPRARVYLPAEVESLRTLFTRQPPAVIRALDACRDAFGEVELEVVTCFTCRGADWWDSTAGQTVCRRCHPPAPGAEREEKGSR